MGAVWLIGGVKVCKGYQNGGNCNLVYLFPVGGNNGDNGMFDNFPLEGPIDDTLGLVSDDIWKALFVSEPGPNAKINCRYDSIKVITHSQELRYKNLEDKSKERNRINAKKSFKNIKNGILKANQGWQTLPLN